MAKDWKVDGLTGSVESAYRFESALQGVVAALLGRLGEKAGVARRLTVIRRPPP